jgi:tetratricopeptide (TPR) repeat protein
MDLDDDYLDPVLNAAELLLHSKLDADEAIRYCERARSLVCIQEELIEVALLETDALLDKGRLEEARQKLVEVGESGSLTAVHNMLVGRSFYEIGDFEMAAEFIDRALEQDPAYVDAWYCRGLLLRVEGKRIDAVAAFMSVLENDRARPTVGWVAQIESVGKLVEQAIQGLGESLRKMLAKTEVVVASLPTREQVCQEIDPRQLVLVEGIDLTHGCFEKLWVFIKNFEYVRVSPCTMVEDLTEVIQSELLLSEGPF